MKSRFWLHNGIMLLFIFINSKSMAQFTTFAKPIIDTLCSPTMHGRGYVQDGVNIAANYLASKMENIGLKSFDKSYFQKYSFDINTLPQVTCSIDGKTYNAGEHFLVDAASPSLQGVYKILQFNMHNNVDEKLFWIKLQNGWATNEALLLKDEDNTKSTKRWLDSVQKLGYKIPLVIKGSAKKLLWSTSQTVDKTPILIFPDTIINKADEISISIKNNLIKDYPCKNIIGYIPGKKKNTKGYIVFTAHYDHLGMLGSSYFPGASDNASGTSMVLNLANYFMQNKQDYPIIFMLFSGEEVGLLGSKYFVEHPLFSVDKIKMLINIDIMGAADEGITVVNGEVFKTQFDNLVAINATEKLLPEIKIRGKAANSDHYFFSEAGIPSFFIYSNGGSGFYHDVWDKPNTIQLKNYDQVAKLLIKFTTNLNR
jgi:aminopeptidase YwaD